MSNPVVNIYGSAFIYYTCDRDPTNNEPMVYNGYSNLLLFWWNTVNNKLFWCIDTTSNSMVWINQINSNNLSSSLSALGIVSPPTPIGTDNQIIVTPGTGTYTFSTPQNINSGASPQFNGLNLSGLTASNFVTTDNSKNLISQSTSQVKNILGLNINTIRSYTTLSNPAFATNYTPSTTNDTFVVANISQTSVLLGSASVNATIGGVTISNASLGGVAATQTNSLSFIVPANSAYQLTQSSSGIGASNSILSIRELSL
jgi:hypothetical protein